MPFTRGENPQSNARVSASAEPRTHLGASKHLVDSEKPNHLTCSARAYFSTVYYHLQIRAIPYCGRPGECAGLPCALLPVLPKGRAGQAQGRRRAGVRRAREISFGLTRYLASLDMTALPTR